MMLDGSLMAVEMTADLEWKDNNPHGKEADIEGVLQQKYNDTSSGRWFCSSRKLKL